MNCNVSSDIEQSSIVGLRFLPTDHELVLLLKIKLDGELTDYEDIIEINNIYDYEPASLRDFSKNISKDDVCHFFHNPKYMGKKAQSCKRRTRAGFWKITGKPSEVKHKITKNEIGIKTILVFRLGRGKGTPTEWVMHEYKYTGGSALKSNQADFVLCKIMKKFKSKRGRNESSFNTSISPMDQNEVCHLMTPSASDKSEPSFDIVASSSNQNTGNLSMALEFANKSESSFNTLIPIMNQNEANHLVASLGESELGYSTPTSPDRFLVSFDKSETSCFNLDISSNFVNEDHVENVATSLHKSESSFNISIAVDEMEPNRLVISSNKSESSFNTNTSSDFHNGNESQIMDNTTMYGNKASYQMASVDITKASFDFRNKNQDLMIIDSTLSYGKAYGIESSSNASISSYFVSKETKSATHTNEDSHAMPSDLGNHMQDRSPSISCDSTYFQLSDFEDVLNHNLHDYNLVDLLNHNFSEGIVQECDSSQLISSSTNCECLETSMYRDFTQNQLMCSDIPMINSESDVLISCDSTDFQLSDFEDVLNHNFHDYNVGDLLNHNFSEGIVQECDSSQLISSSTNCECPETSMYRDFTQNQLMCSDIPTINSESDVLEELEAFF